MARYVYFFISFLISLGLTEVLRRLASKLNIVDRPDEGRKRHGRAVPLLGGGAIFLSFFLVAGYLLYFHPLYDIDIFAGKMLWVFLAGLILLIMGVMDDIKGLPAGRRLLITSLSVILVIVGGVGLEKITNPFGGIIKFDSLFLVADLLVFFWLMGMIYTVKISDGLDGLSAGIVFIGAMMIYFLASTTKYFQPNVGLLSLVFAGACLGFLVLNFYPAKIFLGEGGGLFLGLMLGVLAIIAGGKVATALLVVAVPVLDLARVIYSRARDKKPLFQGDREHLHYRLLDMGFKEWQVVLLFYFTAASFGASALFLQSSQKFMALGVLVMLMIVISVLLRGVRPRG